MARNLVVRSFQPEAEADMTYVFQEYPKHIVVKGRTIVCADADAEAEALKADMPSEADEKKRLTDLATAKGLNVDGRWKSDKIADMIRNAGYDTEV